MASRLTVVLVLLLLTTPAVIFWLWLVIEPVRVAVLCPEGCWCDPGGSYVECINSSLNNIPPIFPTGIRELGLYDNNITALEKDIFISRKLTELRQLVLLECKLQTVELGAFSGLTKLTLLSLSYNKINKVIPGTFEGLSHLEYLRLRNNKIEHLDVDVFSGLINLKYIGLDGNEIHHLHPDIFVGLPNLAELILAHNSGLKIPTDGEFISSHSLSRLDISHCNVSSVSAVTFVNVTALKRLDLSYNNLTSVDIKILEILPNMSTLYLYGNPLQCDCQLRKVWRWCQDFNIETAYEEKAPECYTPSEVQGKYWGVLETGQCSKGNMHYYGDNKTISHSYTPVDVLYHLSFLKQYEIPIYAVFCIFGTAGNVILFFIIISNKDMRTVPNMYLLNLAVSDIISLLINFCARYRIHNSDTKLYGEFLCKLFIFFRRLSIGLSAYSVTVLSIQRYNVTVNPFHVHVSSQPTWRGNVATICAVWVVAALFALPSGLSGDVCFGCLLNDCKYYYKMVAIFELFVSCVLPLFVIAFSYIMTARHLVKSAVPTPDDTQHPQANTRKNTAKILLGLTAVFLISFVPYHILQTYTIFTDVSQFEIWHTIVKPKLQYTFVFSTCLLLLNSCLNPAALFFTSRAFRMQFRRYTMCWPKPKPIIINSEHTSKKCVLN